MNTITLIRRLVRDPELRHTTCGDPVCALRIAVDAMGRSTGSAMSTLAFGARAARRAPAICPVAG